MLFGRGLGDLFIVRVAGNTVDLTGLGSIEYAVDHLGVPLIVVLGRERCGAVSAAISLVKEHVSYDSAIEAMVAPILPAVLKAETMDGDLLDNSVRENISNVVSRLKATGGAIGEKLEAGVLKIVGARYDLDEGKVEFIA
ncbi:carbonic anhydrase [Rhizobium herbae]|uniref:Carbonic anhydrase n=1 Tax=Rhizobium herbae TaxID=508661 RepID=A0ABS4EGM2_9HYPH|nr:carbonic anhydrase [Rhizobium herbae]MBP1857001.1 carbonic anhydrase [Rhizobium herbae]